MTLPKVWVDRVYLPHVLEEISSRYRRSPETLTDRFWSTPERPVEDQTREVVEVELDGDRLVNYLSLAVAHFPHTVTAEYRDDNTGAWLPFLTYHAPPAPGRRLGQPSAGAAGSPAAFTLLDSAPVRVSGLSARTVEHPQHFGGNHWVTVAWKVRPTTCSRARLVLVRNPLGAPPADPSGGPAAYSLGVRGLQLGYRVNSLADVPRGGRVTTAEEPSFATSNDLLGSRVVYSLREQSPSNVLDNDDGSVWRSNPQPVNYAVVNFYADARDASGEGQVVDRFFIDPTTVGAHLNLYYSDDEPDTSYAASDEVLTYPIAQQHGELLTKPSGHPQRGHRTHVNFSGFRPSYIDVQNSYLQFDPSKPWWLGMQMRAYALRDGSGPPGVGAFPTLDHPWLSLGGNVLRQNGARVEFVTEGGEVAWLPLPEGHVHHAEFSVVVVYNPRQGRVEFEDEVEDYPPGVTLLYRLGDQPIEQATFAVRPITGRPSVVRVGGYPSAAAPGYPAITVRSMILKEAHASQQEAEAFTDDGQAFTRKPDFDADDAGTTDDAVLRMLPEHFSHERSTPGLLGGPGDRYADMVWTPVQRDYTLRRGFLQVPPTRARYWKFEFTQLVAEHYEAFVPVRREMQFYTSETVKSFQAVAGFGAWHPRHGGPGVRTMLDLTHVARYSDAVDALRTDGHRYNGVGLGHVRARGRGHHEHGPTEALYSHDPSQQERMRRYGWAWSFQPWHVGSSAPRFVQTQRHHYEKVVVEHKTKVAYFAGIKRLEAYRVDYLADDDTDVYTEHFHDAENLVLTSGLALARNRLTSLGHYGEATSKTFASQRPVRALQFATTQSDAQQLLPDDGFLDQGLAAWRPYGDAELRRDGDALVVDARAVVVNRGYRTRRYGDVESGTYASVESRTYGDLEGGLDRGLAGGGLASARVTPSNAGRVYAAARVSAAQTLSGPVRVELVSAEGDLVLAAAQREVRAGETADLYAGYTVGSAQAPRTWGDVEALGSYGAAEGRRYLDYETRAIRGDVYARVVQAGASSDTFTVRRLSIFDDPISWQFSVDGGARWYDAMDVRNNADGVLSFPVAGTSLRWRLRTYRPGAAVTALSIRPWYGGLMGGSPSGHGMSVSGPNRSVVDQYPPIEADPMWRQWDEPVPSWWYDLPRQVEGGPVVDVVGGFGQDPFGSARFGAV